MKRKKLDPVHPTALRFARYFGMSPQFWLGLQMDYDLERTEDAVESRIDKEINPLSPAV